MKTSSKTLATDVDIDVFCIKRPSFNVFFRLFSENFPANLEALSWMDTKIGQLLGTLFSDELFSTDCKLPKR